LIAEEHFKAQFLKDFKKDHGGLVKRVEEFIMPSFKVTSNQIEEIPNVRDEPSDLLNYLSIMMDKKISVVQLGVGDMLASMFYEIDALKRIKMS